MTGLLGIAGECCAAPLRVRAKEVERRMPLRLELCKIPEKSSADLDGGATSF